MVTDIHLEKNRGFRWYSMPVQCGTVWVKGYAFRGGTLLREGSLGELFRTALASTRIENRLDKLTQMLVELNGMFAVVFVGEREFFASVDRLRSTPLFYARQRNVMVLSDSAQHILSCLDDSQLAPMAKAEFFLTGYVTGPDTLCPHIEQIQAGHFLYVDYSYGLRDIQQNRYYRYVHSYDKDVAQDELLRRLDQSLVNVFERLITLADGRTIVVPLSGGYDSRLIVLMLTQLGYENVIAFSYGRPGNKQSEISKAIAEALHIPWEFIPYSKDLWYRWHRSEDWANYFDYAHELCTLPHLQDWPAVWCLREKGRIPDESVFVPGHSADLLAGSRSKGSPSLYMAESVAVRPTVDAIMELHYSLFSLPRRCSDLRSAFEARILRTLGDLQLFPDSASAFEAWDVAERQAKFIINSVRAYEFWGYEWALPLWDTAFMEYWATVPLNYRRGKELYDLYVSKKQAAMDGVALPSIDPTYKVRDHLKEMFRGSCAHRLLKWAYGGAHMRREYDSHPLEWYGIVTRDEFLRMSPRPTSVNGVLMYRGFAHYGAALRGICQP